MKTRKMTIEVKMPARVADWLESMKSPIEEFGINGALAAWLEEQLGGGLARDVQSLLFFHPVTREDELLVKKAEQLDKLNLQECFEVLGVRFADVSAGRE